MGWRAGDFYVAAGATIRASFWWPHPGDKGAQWAMAHPKAGEPPCSLATERVGKSVACEIAWVNSEGDYGCVADTAYWTYYADIKNDSSTGCRFQLEGGGV